MISPRFPPPSLRKKQVVLLAVVAAAELLMLLAPGGQAADALAAAVLHRVLGDVLTDVARHDAGAKVRAPRGRATAARPRRSRRG